MFYSDVLPAESLRQILDDSPEALKLLLGDSMLTAYYGFGTNIHHASIISTDAGQH